MKYKEIYADVPVGTFPDSTLERTNRIYACDICKTRTPWRDWTSGYTVPVCSEECRLEVINRFLEVHKEEQNANSEARGNESGNSGL